MPKIPPRYPIDVQRHAAEQVLHHHHPVAQVAKQLRCSPQSIKNWIEKYQKSVPARSNPPPSSHTTFLPLQVGAVDLPPPQIELVTKNGSTLRFPVETPSETLCGIVKRLEVASC